MFSVYQYKHKMSSEMHSNLFTVIKKAWLIHPLSLKVWLRWRFVVSVMEATFAHHVLWEFIDYVKNSTHRTVAYTLQLRHLCNVDIHVILYSYCKHFKLNIFHWLYVRTRCGTVCFVIFYAKHFHGSIYDSSDKHGLMPCVLLWIGSYLLSTRGSKNYTLNP